MKTTIFEIEGMRCDACANTIRKLVENEPGVRMASVSFSERLVRVLYDPQAVAEDRLVDAIQKSGFRVVGRKAASESPVEDSASQDSTAQEKRETDAGRRLQ